MKLTFRIRYSTHFGQSFWLSYGLGDDAKTIPMTYRDATSWQVSIDLPVEATGARVDYHYLVRNPDGSETKDAGGNSVTIPAALTGNELLLIDSWNDIGAPANVFYTEPFKAVLLRENSTGVQSVAPSGATHTFRVKAPLLTSGQTLCLLGEGARLGNWNTTSPLLLNRSANENYLSVEIDLRRQNLPCAYKYGIFDLDKMSFVRFEAGANRILDDSISPGRRTVVNDGFASLPADTWRGTGVCIPVFSLRSGNGFGVGEFADLKSLADWGKQVGLKLIQILPVNDTTVTHSWTDSYPYAAISAFALHPIYLNIHAVADDKNRKWITPLEPGRRRLNALDAVDYEAVMKAKLGFLRKILPLQGAATFRTKEYKSFFKENSHWLVPYAAFCFLRDKYGTANFNEWPEHNRYNAKKITALVKGNDEVALHFFIQFHLHRQLQEAAAYAHSQGLVIKGDIAIGVHRHSADVWQQGELFHTDVQAGAPPDPFSDKGQNWGFPTYNWPRMAADGFAWWKQRFAQMSNYFDAFRIDHILGFFRIWSIPTDAVEGILGYFVPAIPMEAAEFTSRGVSLDHGRLTKPYITDPILKDIFDGLESVVRRDFLKKDGAGSYVLKDGFATQRQVEKYFATKDANERNTKLKLGLYDLISNVVLLEAERGSGRQFHFRFGIDQTSSFKALPPQAQIALRGLYIDYFFRRQDDLWLREALQKLPELKHYTNMLICGEDLGFVPACVPVLMKQLGLLSLEIQRMPKELGQELSRPADAPYLSVVTPSTHDMSTIRGWWEEDRNLIQKFYIAELHEPGEAPRQCEPRIVQAVVRQHLASPAMWSIFQLQDLLGTDGALRRPDVQAERINEPANPRHYWRYRMNLTLDQLRSAHGFNARLAGMIHESGR